MDINSLLIEIICTRMRIRQQVMNTQAFLVHTHEKMHVFIRVEFIMSTLEPHTTLHRR